MRLAARFNLAGSFTKPGSAPEPLDLALRLTADLHSVWRRELPIEGTLTAPGLADIASVVGELGRRRLTLRFESDQGEALMLRATARAFPEAPLLSLSVFDGHVRTRTGELRCDVELRFDFRHDLRELFRSVHLRRARSQQSAMP